MGNVSIGLSDYCKKSRGQNPYDLDCHKFVDCWDSNAFLKTCHPPSLVFDPIESVCKWNWEAGMTERCKKKNSIVYTISTTSNFACLASLIHKLNFYF